MFIEYQTLQITGNAVSIIMAASRRFLSPEALGRGFLYVS